MREEFTREASGRIKTLADYRKLEDRLFEELRHEVYEQPAESAARGMLSRYTARKSRGSDFRISIGPSNSMPKSRAPASC